MDLEWICLTLKQRLDISRYLLTHKVGLQLAVVTCPSLFEPIIPGRRPGLDGVMLQLELVRGQVGQAAVRSEAS
jgi:hypothetical protein